MAKEQQDLQELNDKKTILLDNLHEFRINQHNSTAIYRLIEQLINYLERLDPITQNNHHQLNYIEGIYTQIHEAQHTYSDENIRQYLSQPHIQEPEGNYLLSFLRALPNILNEMNTHKKQNHQTIINIKKLKIRGTDSGFVRDVIMGLKMYVCGVEFKTLSDNDAIIETTLKQLNSLVANINISRDSNDIPLYNCLISIANFNRDNELWFWHKWWYATNPQFRDLIFAIKSDLENGKNPLDDSNTKFHLRQKEKRMGKFINTNKEKIKLQQPEEKGKKITNLEIQIEDIKKQKNEEIEKINATLKEQESQITKKDEELAKLRVNNDKLTKATQDLIKNNEKQTKYEQTLQIEIDSLKEELKGKSTDRENKLRETNQILLKENENLKTENTILQNKIQDLEKFTNGLKETNKLLYQTLSNKDILIKQQEEQINSQNTVISNLKEKIKIQDDLLQNQLLEIKSLEKPFSLFDDNSVILSKKDESITSYSTNSTHNNNFFEEQRRQNTNQSIIIPTPINNTNSQSNSRI